MVSLNDKVCRLCLLTDSSELLNIFDGEATNSIISSKINLTLKCKIARTDKLPKFVCRECVSTIEFISAYNFWLEEIVNKTTNVQRLLESCDTDQNAIHSIISELKDRNSPKSEQSMQPLSNTSVYSCYYTSIMENIYLRMQNSQSEKTGKLNSMSDKQTMKESDSLVISPSSTSFDTGKNSQNSQNDEDNNSLCEENSSSNDSFDLQTLPDKKIDELVSHEELTCPECRKVFKKRNLLMRHLMSHESAIKKYQCQICRRKFISTSDVQRHTRAHMGLKPYKCKLCFRFFSQKNLLDNHMDWHEGKKSHLCDICGMSLSSAPNLKMHKENLHSLEKKKPFICKECGKSFSRKHHLENHFTTHVSARPFQCTACGLTFKRSSQLQEHEMVHTGEKQFDCTVCKKAFRTKRVLNVHKLLHSGLKPHQCTICSQSFVRKGGLTVHMKSHSK